nr:nucleotidyltransferase family protein [uncultured Desulfuromonas sp.]
MGKSYTLLAHFLSPYRPGELVETLREYDRKGRLDWKLVLYQANLSFCTPLWYSRLRQKGLLDELPEDLQEYLQVLHQANVERNEAFQASLVEILSSLQDMRIHSVLLKGAATFCDGLYGSSGARLMGDVDILIEPGGAERVQEVLIRSGYVPVPTTRADTYSPEYLPQHLPRMLKPHSPVAVEIHVRVERGQAGRILPAGLAWANSQKVVLGGYHTAVLSPTYRLLHNTVHGLLSQREFIQSNISLLQLAEFAELVSTYENEIDWGEWHRRGAEHGAAREFGAYLTLACNLMGVPWPDGVRKHRLARIDAARIEMAGNRVGKLRDRTVSMKGRLGEALAGWFVNFFYNLCRPLWVWRNVCHVEGNIPLSIGMMLKKLWSNLGLRVGGR